MSVQGRLLSSADDIIKLCEVLKKQKMIGVDTEFIRESTFFPIVELIQIGTDTESWLVDARAFKEKHSPRDPHAFHPGLKPLLAILSDPNILKLVHAAAGDQECLYTSFGIVASPLLDTAVAASLCGYGENIGLSKLLKSVLQIQLDKGHARTNWSVRPLPQPLIDYAHADVRYLVRLGQALLEQLDQLGRRKWALRQSAQLENVALYSPHPTTLAQRLARGGRLDRRLWGVLFHLVEWREERVRQLNLPRRWVADDQILLNLARVCPSDLNHLSSFRGLNQGELRQSGAVILAAIQKGLSQQEVSLPGECTKTQLPSPEETQVLELMRFYLRALAAKYQIASKYLLSTHQLLVLLRSSIHTVQGWVDAQLISHEVAQLVGAELIALLRGQRALFIRNQQLEVMSLDGSDE